MKNIFIGFIVFLIILTIPVFVYLNNFERYAFDLSFYDEEFEENNISKQVNNSLFITKQLLSYLKSKQDSRIETDVFNEKEKEHLLEVRALMQTALKIRNYSFFVLILLCMLLFLLYKDNYVFLRKLSTGILGGSLLIIVLFLLGVMLLSNFTGSFYAFHELSFKTNTWLLNPETDLLIVLFPENFFYNITKGIFVSSLLQAVIMFIFSSLMLFLHFRLKKQKK